MQDKPLSEVYLGDGQGEGFWNIGFNDLQRRYADVKTEDMRSICVHVDETTGELTLSEGYVPGSPEDEDEQSLFSDFEDAIVREMVADHRFSAHAAFLARAEETALQRDDLLSALDVSLAEMDEDD